MIRYHLDENNFLTGSWATVGGFENQVELEEPLQEVDLNMRWVNGKFVKDQNPKLLVKEYKQELEELEKWFEEYDKQVIQYQRSLRLGIEFDKDINELDEQAVVNAARIKELRTKIHEMEIQGG